MDKDMLYFKNETFEILVPSFWNAPALSLAVVATKCPRIVRILGQTLAILFRKHYRFRIELFYFNAKW